MRWPVLSSHSNLQNGSFNHLLHVFFGGCSNGLVSYGSDESCVAMDLESGEWASRVMYEAQSTYARAGPLENMPNWLPSNCPQLPKTMVQNTGQNLTLVETVRIPGAIVPSHGTLNGILLWCPSRILLWHPQRTPIMALLKNLLF